MKHSLRLVPIIALVQALGLLAALAAALFAPETGQASVLIPLRAHSPQESARLVARWVTREEAQWVAFDPATGRATVIAPSARSLASAISSGFLPIASDIPTCTATPAGPQTESIIA